MNSWRYALGEFRRRPGRSLLSLLSVVIAVAAIVAVSSATATTRTAYRHVFESLAGRADLEVASIGGGYFPQAEADKLRTLPHVRAVVPVLNATTKASFGGKRVAVLASAIDAHEPESLAGYHIAEGSFPTDRLEIAVEANLAANLHLSVGDEVRLTPLMHPFKVSGIFTLEDAARLHQSGMLLMSLKRLQRSFRASGRVVALHLLLDDPKHSQQVIAEAQAVLPATLRVGKPALRSKEMEDTMLLNDVSLLMVSTLSFLTAVFIVLSVFLMTISERRRQLSILRAVGATRGQIIGMVCYEALLMGLAGTLVGLPLGVYGGALLMRSMASLLGVRLPARPDLNWVFILGGLIGPLVCLIASWYPAFMASRVSPLEGLRPTVTIEPGRGHRTTTVIGVIGLLITLIGGVGAARGYLPIWASVGSLVLSLISVVLLLPIMVPPAVRWLAWPVHSWLGIEGQMAERLVLRRGTRSALTIGVLFISVSTSLGVGNAVFTINDDIHRWIDRTITADFLLRVTMPDASGQAAATMPESLGDEIRKLPGVEHVDPAEQIPVDVAGQKARLVSRDFSQYTRAPIYVLGDDSHVEEQLRAGQAVVGSVLAERLGVHPGDTIDVTAGTDKFSFKVAALTTEYTLGGLILTIDQSTARRLYESPGVSAFFIKAKPGQAAEVESQLRVIEAEKGLMLQSYSELVTRIDATVAGTTGGLWVMLVMGLLVSALGVVNTLMMNVLEQTRELGMLRAIGMRRRQIVKTVLGQAGIIGWVGILTGAASGIALSNTFNACLRTMFGRYMPYALRPEYAAALVVSALVVVLVTALYPAWRAANLNILQSMRQD